MSHNYLAILATLFLTSSAPAKPAPARARLGLPIQFTAPASAIPRPSSERRIPSLASDTTLANFLARLAAGSETPPAASQVPESLLENKDRPLKRQRSEE